MASHGRLDGHGAVASLHGMRSATSHGQPKNLHVPLPEDMYRRLREESERSARPATALAREAIDQWLVARRADAVREAIVEYATSVSGTSDDLDPCLESAAAEHELDETRRDPEEDRK